ncbi:MAG: 16S rRNA (adenine(1518)-N(6)/adenine(1519)-N(6))-dimethyltransferase RsmA [Candidatus Marinimicrobia bacterium]|nr:16S rRNA (adenine(1518)-N(6)/adenine(1519)-N(6))-dimethyltransferase RsmA [Candidatus Neomarinimicrobiota bacterium]
MSQPLPRPLKKWGQNFLVDPALREKIIREINPQPEDVVVEIGPGTGVLTNLLIPKVRQIHAVEVDERMGAFLDPLKRAHKNFTWVVGDFLEWTPVKLPTPFRLMGNLPYYISSPLILKTFELRPVLVDAHFLLQKEMARRLAAEVGTKAYGILTVYARLFARVRYLFDISPGVFIPRPEVDSGFIRLTFTDNKNWDKNLDLTLRALVRSAFQKRRKTLRNSLASVLPVDFDLSRVLNADLRADAVTPEQYLLLAQTVVDATGGKGLKKPVY